MKIPEVLNEDCIEKHLKVVTLKKWYLISFVFQLLVLATSAQQLKVKDFESSLYCEQPNHKEFLVAKGFHSGDSTMVEAEESYFTDGGTELLKIYTKKDNTGGSLIEVKYYLSSKNDYRKFSNALNKSKFKFSKKEHHYRKVENSYSFLQLKLEGNQLVGKRSYYLISFKSVKGKELSMPEK